MDSNHPVPVTTVTGVNSKDLNLFDENLIRQNCFDSHIDPDSNFFRNLTNNCCYYSETLFNLELKAINGFSLIHFNARSLNANSDKINRNDNDSKPGSLVD